MDLHEFNPELTLVPGQSFNWQRLGDDKIWVGIVDTHPLIFAQEGSTNRVASLDGSLSGEELMSLVREYLQLNIALTELYATVRPARLQLIIYCAFCNKTYFAVVNMLPSNESCCRCSTRNSPAEPKPVGVPYVVHLLFE